MNAEHSCIILGCHVRISTSKLPSLWTTARRDLFLLKPSVGVPLSADKAVWPLTADFRIEPKLRGVEMLESPRVSNGLALSPVTGNVPVLARRLSKTSGHIVAFGIPQKSANRLCYKHRIEFAVPSSAILEMGAHFVGFDVCDDWFMSGLMNCGLETNALLRLREQFGPLINQFGLFDRAGEANDLGVVLDRLVAEHAPFGPVGLFIFGSVPRHNPLPNRCGTGDPRPEKEG